MKKAKQIFCIALILAVFTGIFTVIQPVRAQEEAVLGDVSGNGKVDIEDARLVLQHLVGKIILNETQLATADVDGNGVSITSARLILQYLVGKVTEFPDAEYPTEPTSATATSTEPTTTPTESTFATAASTEPVTTSTESTSATTESTEPSGNIPNPPTGVTLDVGGAKEGIDLYVGKTRQLVATVTPADASDRSVTWSSNNPDVAFVSQSGLVIGLSPGNARITVKTNVGGYSYYCDVLVRDGPFANIYLYVSPDSAQIKANGQTENINNWSFWDKKIPAGISGSSITITYSIQINDQAGLGDKCYINELTFYSQVNMDYIESSYYQSGNPVALPNASITKSGQTTIDGISYNKYVAGNMNTSPIGDGGQKILYLTFKLANIPENSQIATYNLKAEITSYSAGGFVQQYPDCLSDSNSDTLNVLPQGFDYILSNNQITITGNKYASANLTIPSTMFGYPVIAIADKAFEWNKTIQNLIIPGSVKVIGKSAFRYCELLESIELQNGVQTIKESAFELYNSNYPKLKTIKIPVSVTSIEPTIEVLELTSPIGEVTFKTKTYYSNFSFSYDYVPWPALEKVYVVKGSYAESYFKNFDSISGQNFYTNLLNYY
ncbi:MAG: Ig-like domain-containing protein [Oscillospiraceae bacterium]|nr:Ig-like domain-containing protein [Oscillospiraceae bacterium]